MHDALQSKLGVGQLAGHLLNAVEWLLRFLVAVGTAEADAETPALTDRSQVALGSHPSFGTWAAALQRLGREHGARGSRSQAIDIRGAAALMQPLLAPPALGGIGRSRWSDLASFRNWLAHGNILDAESATSAVAVLLPLFDSALDSLDQLFEATRLVAVRSSTQVDTSTGSSIPVDASTGPGVYLTSDTAALALAPLVRYGPSGFGASAGPERNVLQLFLRMRNGIAQYTPLDEQALIGIGSIDEASAYRRRFTDEAALRYFWDGAAIEAAGMIGRAREVEEIVAKIDMALLTGNSHRTWKLLAGPGAGKSTLISAVALGAAELRRGPVVFHQFHAADPRSNLTAFLRLALDTLGLRVPDSPEDAARAFEKMLGQAGGLDATPGRVPAIICDGLDELATSTDGAADLQRLASLSRSGGVWIFSGRPTKEVTGVLGEVPDALRFGLPGMTKADSARLLISRLSPNVQDVIDELGPAGSGFVSAVVDKAEGLPLYITLTADWLERQPTVDQARSEIRQAAQDPNRLAANLGDLYGRMMDSWGAGDLAEVKTMTVCLLCAAAEPVTPDLLAAVCVADYPSPTDQQRAEMRALCAQAVALMSSVLSQEADSDGQPAYRVAHDSFRQYIAESHQLSFRRNMSLLASFSRKAGTWDETFDRHAFRHGIGYLLQAAAASDAVAMLVDPLYITRRLTALGADTLPGLFTDLIEVERSADQSVFEAFERVADFLRKQRSLLERGTSEWGPELILRQLVAELPDSHPIAPWAGLLGARDALEQVRRRGRVTSADQNRQLGALRLPGLVAAGWTAASGSVLLQTFDEEVILAVEARTATTLVGRGAATQLSDTRVLIEQIDGVWLFDLETTRQVRRVAPRGKVFRVDNRWILVRSTESFYSAVDVDTCQTTDFGDVDTDSLVALPGRAALAGVSRDGTAWVSEAPFVTRTALRPNAKRMLATRDGHLIIVTSDEIMVVDPRSGVASSATELGPAAPDFTQVLAGIGADGCAWQNRRALWIWRPSDGFVEVEPPPNTIYSNFIGVGRHGVLGIGSRCIAVVWDSHSGARLGQLNEHRDEGSVVGALALSDGRFVSWDGSAGLDLWAVSGETVEREAELFGHLDRVDRAIETKPGVLASCGHDFTLRWWDLGTAPQPADSRPVRRKAPSADRSVSVVGTTSSGAVAVLGNGPSNHAYEFDPTTTKLRALGRSRARHIELLPDGRMAIWTHDGDIRIREPDGAQGPLLSTDVMPSGVLLVGHHWLLAITASEEWPMWPLPSGADPVRISGHHGRGPGAIALDDRDFVTWTRSTPPRRWTVDEAGRVELLGSFALPEDEAVGCAAAWVLPNGQLAAVTGRGELRVWSIEPPQLVHRLHDPSLVLPGVSASGNHLLTWARGGLASLYDFSIRVWDLSEGRLVKLIAGHTHPVVGASWLDNAVASWSMDGTVVRWDSSTGVSGRASPTGPIVGAKLLADGRGIFWTGDGTVTVLDLAHWAILGRATYELALDGSGCLVEPGLVVIGAKMPKPLVIEGEALLGSASKYSATGQNLKRG